MYLNPEFLIVFALHIVKILMCIEAVISYHLYQADCNLLRPMVTLEEAQDGLGVWLESAFPESGIKAADFEAKLYDNGYIFTTQLKGDQVIDGHYPGTQMVIRYDRNEGVTRLNYYEY